MHALGLRLEALHELGSCMCCALHCVAVSTALHLQVKSIFYIIFIIIPAGEFIVLLGRCTQISAHN